MRSIVLLFKSFPSVFTTSQISPIEKKNMTNCFIKDEAMNLVFSRMFALRTLEFANKFFGSFISVCSELVDINQILINSMKYICYV